MQKGRPNDPESMLLVARAQSLSGRPADALVMIRRLMAMGIELSIVNGDDFRRVRALPNWPEVEAAIAAGAATASPAPKSSTAVRSEPATRTLEKTSAGKPASKPERAESSATVNAAPASRRGPADAIRLPASDIEPIGLAYDSVSRRFVVGDRRQNRLIVADEVFKQVNDLIGAGSGGFGRLTAVEIDRRRGDLWATSTNDNGRAAVHKLQLVSGRVLARIEVPDDWLPATLVDIAISDAGMLLLVDGAGSRLLSVATSGQSFAGAVPLGVFSPTSAAPANGTTYVAHTDGLSIVDGLRNVEAVRPAKGVALAGLQRIRWHRGSLIAIQDDGQGGDAKLVRIRFARSGRTASALEVLDDHEPEKGSALTVSSNSAYYLARGQDGPSIRRVPLR